MNSIALKGLHLDRLDVDKILNHVFVCQEMDASCFSLEDTCFELDFDTIDAVCPVICSPSSDDVADILQSDSLDSLISGLMTSTNTMASDSFSSLYQIHLGNTFSLEDRWPI